MLVLFTFFVCMFSATYSNIHTNFQEELTGLKQIHVIMRHGARNPTSFFPTDPNKDHKFLGGLGQLNNLGKLQAYSMGKFMNKRYSGFLTSDPKEIYTRSTEVDRTVETALAVLAGLYPPEGEWIWNEELKWQPIRVYTKPTQEDYSLSYKAPCPAAAEEFKVVMTTGEGRNFDSESATFREYLSKKTRMDIKSFYEIMLVYTTLEIERNNNLTMPYWVTDGLLKKMEEYSVLVYRLYYCTRFLQRLRAGPLIGEAINNMKSILNETMKRKVFLYSTHDSVVAAVLNALDVFNYKIPPFCATIIIELHSFGAEPFLRFYYSNSTTPEKGSPGIHLLKLPFCDADCPLETFIKHTKDIIPIDIKKECLNSNKNLF